MDCAEIRSGFVSGRVPDASAVAEHLAGCAPCRELFAQDSRLGGTLAQGVMAPPQLEQLFALVERELGQEVGVRAKLRAWPTRVRVTALVALSVTIAGGDLLLRSRRDFASYSAAAFAGLALILTIGLAAAAARWARGAAQPLHSAFRERGVILAFLLLPALTAVLSPVGALGAADVWQNPLGCFALGVAISTPLLFVMWLFERRNAPPVLGLSLAGALVGLSANLMLHSHCPSTHPGHLLLGHATVGAVWAAALGLLSHRFARPSLRG